MSGPQVRLFEDIGHLLTLEGVARKQARHVDEPDLGEIKDAVIVCRNDKIVWRGAKAELTKDLLTQLSQGQTVERISLKGQTVLPAFVECHTHLVFAGSRAEEFEWRQAGQTYQEISAKGGGILSTVKQTRAATEDELLKSAQARADRFVAQGVTALEIKSGYGLNQAAEVKCLEVAQKIRGPKIVRTYLGAHSRSLDHPDLASYMKSMIEETLPLIARRKLADRIDIYIEKGFFEHDLAKSYLSKAKELGLAVTAHVEQLSHFGGTELALNFEPQSVDHVVYIDKSTTDRLAKSKTTAVLLPASDFYLKMKYPPARELIEAGTQVALSTDFNPGTSPTQDLSFIGVLARLELKMTLPEVIAAWTLGAAAALGLESERGSLCVGKTCDFTVLDCGWRDLFYSVGHHPVTDVYRNGDSLINP